MTGPPSILGGIDQFLRMFGAQPHRERLRFHADAPLAQKAVRVVRALADGQNHTIRFDLLSVVDRHRRHFAAADDKIRHTGFKPNVASHLHKFLPQPQNHLTQPVRSDVRLGIRQNRFRRSHFHQHLPDPSRGGIFGPAGQLPVGKGSRAAFAEKDIAFRMEQAPLPEIPYIRNALLHGPSPFQKDNGNGIPGKSIGGKKPCRPAADDDHRLDLPFRRFSKRAAVVKRRCASRPD